MIVWVSVQWVNHTQKQCLEGQTRQPHENNRIMTYLFLTYTVAVIKFRKTLKKRKGLKD